VDTSILYCNNVIISYCSCSYPEVSLCFVWLEWWREGEDEVRSGVEMVCIMSQYSSIRGEWLLTVARCTLHTNTYLSHAAVGTLKSVVRHYPGWVKKEEKREKRKEKREKRKEKREKRKEKFERN
jgi:hypothetical protein